MTRASQTEGVAPITAQGERYLIPLSDDVDTVPAQISVALSEGKA